MSSFLNPMFDRAEVRFFGRVQGVYFRDFTSRHAVPLEITGWVMNLPDGSVEAVFEGKRNAIEELIRRLCYEHPHARVNDVSISWSKGDREHSDFQIRHG